ncbi:MAG: lysophospholipid acyltransferase family protein [Prolixibacteraceae bacterium]|nr:lysophospholipid acyltransferase family protein [Prolixibacteraceae bacterium]
MDLNTPDTLYPNTRSSRFFGGDAFTRLVMHLMQMKKVNKLYTELAHESGLGFIDKLLETLDIRYDIDSADLEKIPETGAFITVSNHPFGGLDGMLLIKILSEKRPDVKILASSLLKKITPLNDFFLFDGNDEPSKAAIKMRKNIKLPLNHLSSGGCLCIFPAGEVSGYDQYYNVNDREWQYSILKLIKKSGVPVLPVYFSGSNSRLFHLLGMINPQLQNIKLPSELLNKKNKLIKVRISQPIRHSEIDKFSDIHQLGRYLRAKTYSMGAYESFEVKKFFKTRPPLKISRQEEIIPAVDVIALKNEIEKIKCDYTLFSLKNYTIYCAPSKLIPGILNEIGRLREITFRLVGEGTNMSIDIDEYDLYYNQLFIWDNEENCIVGAYRIGKGNDILHQFGINGFYIKSLFRIRPRFKNILRQSLELGRSFVIKEYQRKPLPLFMLWKGLLYFLLKNPQYRYLVGPVSISNNYSPVSKDTIIRFITANYFNRDLAKYIRPRKAYRFVSESPEVNLLIENAGADLNKFDRLIGDIDKMNSGIPVLLKKYLSLNAKILAFNVDPSFSNCLDGLIILDVYDVPQQTIVSLSKEVNDGSILERFYSSRELTGIDTKVNMQKKPKTKIISK